MSNHPAGKYDGNSTPTFLFSTFFPLASKNTLEITSHALKHFFFVINQGFFSVKTSDILL